MSKFFLSSTILVVLLLPRGASAVTIEEADPQESCLEKLNNGVFQLTNECFVNTPEGVLLYLETGEAELDGKYGETRLIRGNLRVSTSGLSHTILGWDEVEIHPEGTVDVTIGENQLVIYSRKNSTLILVKSEEFFLAPQETIAFDRDGNPYYFRDSEGVEKYYDQGGCSSVPGSQKSSSLIWVFAALLGVIFMRKRGRLVSRTN